MMYMARWQVWTILVICLLGVIYAAPNVLPREVAERIPSWLPHQQVTLGLDLQGGSHLLLEVDTRAVARERLTNLVDAIRTTMRAKRIPVTNLAVAGTDAVTFRVREAGQVDQARAAVREVDPNAQVTVTPEGVFTVQLNPQELIQQARSAVQQSVEIIRRRIDETGTRDPTIQAQGEDRILVQLPGLRDPQRIKELLGQTAKLTFHLLDLNNSVADAMAGRVPPGSLLLPGDARDVDASGQPRMYLVQRRVSVAGERLTDAQPGQNPQTGEWVVNFKFDTVGARQFADITRANVGRPFAIVLDNKVLSAPVIREPILAGSGQISGSFTPQSAQDLAVLLRAGALPAPLNVIEERTVGPDLGADSIKAGAYASVIAVILVAGLMIVAYGLFGVFSVIALFFNLCLLIAALSVLGATLTLPGIAGIVLTMGMAVDANVLIYERIREELRHGQSALYAIDTGFRRAMATIIDSNLTTLIAAFLLFLLGSGPVRGFAVVLSLGIVTSVFSAVLVTRLIVGSWYRSRRPKVVPI